MRLTRSLPLCLGATLLASACVEVPEFEATSVNPATLGSLPLAPESAIGPRFIVVFRDEARGRSALRAAGAAVVLDLPNHSAVAAHIPAQAVPGLSRNPNIALVEPDVARQPFAQSIPYGYNQVGTNLIADLEPTAGPVTVCIIDSGYDALHEDLPSTNVEFTTDVGSGTSNSDTCEHGTHVAGTIAALNNDLGVLGINNSGNLKLKIVKVFDGTNCAWSYSSSLIKALDTCRANVTGKLVVNMSLGGSYSSTTERTAFDNAYAAGVLSIAAAGNGGNTATSYPAGYASVVSIAAIDANKNRANFSQYNSDVELSAPGVGILSTLPGNRYQAWDGTSMATPHVVGVAARIWNLVPTASNAQVRQALSDTAQDLGTPGRDNSYGFGLIQAKAALDRLNYLVTQPVCTPVAEVCTDGIDNDCDGATDALDSNCQTATCLARNASCSTNNDCCSKVCKVKGNRRICN